jgi:hypothetical protein
VTRRHGEKYTALLVRTRENGIGRRVKIDDLKDNIETVKAQPLEKTLRDKLDKYQKALAALD